jgi:hypothetical protein
MSKQPNGTHRIILFVSLCVVQLGSGCTERTEIASTQASLGKGGGLGDEDCAPEDLPCRMNGRYDAIQNARYAADVTLSSNRWADTGKVFVGYTDNKWGHRFAVGYNFFDDLVVRRWICGVGEWTEAWDCEQLMENDIMPGADEQSNWINTPAINDMLGADATKSLITDLDGAAIHVLRDPVVKELMLTAAGGEHPPDAGLACTQICSDRGEFRSELIAIGTTFLCAPFEMFLGEVLCHGAGHGLQKAAFNQTSCWNECVTCYNDLKASCAMGNPYISDDCRRNQPWACGTGPRAGQVIRRDMGP